MPYLRLLTNALLSGLLAAAVLAHIVLLLNPRLPLTPAVVFSLGWRLVATVGATITFLFFLTSLARYLVTRRGPGWLSLRLLAWMTTVVVGLGAFLAWLNLSAYEASIAPAAARRFAAAAVTLTATAAVLLLIALVHYGFGRRGSRVGGALVGIAILATVVLPLVARGSGDSPLETRPVARAVDPTLREPPAGHVWIVLVDGASLDYISPAAARGRLPHLGRLLDGGASLTLFSIEPRQPQPIWASVATGRYPHGTGIAGAHRYKGGWAELERLPRYVFADALLYSGLLQPIDLVSSDLAAVPLWRILDASGVSMLTVGWPLAEPHGLRVGQVIDAPADDGFDPDALDRTLLDRFDEALAVSTPRVAAVRLSALARFGPEGLALWAGPAQRRTVDATYDAVDAEVGRVLERLGPDDLLLVVSGYRLEPTSPVLRLRERLLDDAGLAAEASRSDGFLLAYGRYVSPGRKSVGAIVDVVPTVLYYLGLPVARDFDGFARTDLFNATLTTGRPVSFIRSYQAD